MRLEKDITKCHEGVKAYDEKILVQLEFCAAFPDYERLGQAHKGREMEI